MARISKFGLGCIALLILFSIAVPAEACPTCKEAVAENGSNMVRGYFWSICFMMSMPFLIFTAVSTLMFSRFRKAGAIDQRYSPEVAAKLGIASASGQGLRKTT